LWLNPRYGLIKRVSRSKLAVTGTRLMKVFQSQRPLECRVNLSGPDLFVNLTKDAAELVSRSADYHQSMLLTLSELDEIVSGALLACENKNLREIQVRYLTLKVDARLDRVPKSILQ
jgi:hypothetical protein